MLGKGNEGYVVTIPLLGEYYMQIIDVHNSEYWQLSKCQ
jgi:hypothetical protein